MSRYIINLKWENKFESLIYDQFSRDHVISLSGEQTLKNSSSPDYLGNSEMANPEELLAAALASCHMLTFLAIASKTGYNVSKYTCQSEAIMGKNSEGRMSVTEINLTPVIEFTGEKRPLPEQLTSMHEKAHKNCFIAQSIQSKVNIL